MVSYYQRFTELLQTQINRAIAQSETNEIVEKMTGKVAPVMKLQ